MPQLEHHATLATLPKLHDTRYKTMARSRQRKRCSLTYVTTTTVVSMVQQQSTAALLKKREVPWVPCWASRAKVQESESSLGWGISHQTPGGLRRGQRRREGRPRGCRHGGESSGQRGGLGPWEDALGEDTQRSPMPL